MKPFKPHEFLRSLKAGEYDGQIHEVLSTLTPEQLYSVAALALTQLRDGKTGAATQSGR